MLRTLAVVYGVKYKSTPGYRVYDRIHRSYIALSYTMELIDGKCPFLSQDNRCTLHYVYKPLICRSFPHVPRQVRYNIVWGLRVIYASVEYGVSIECPVVKRDKQYIEALLAKGSLDEYLGSEKIASLEMEKARNTLLSLLSELWRKGVVELSENPGIRAPVINLYDLLRKYYPNLPYILGISRVLERREQGVRA